MGGSAHSIHFMNRGYKQYRDRCLEIWGLRYEDIEVQIDQSYNPRRLPRVEANQSEGSKVSDIAGTEGPKGQCDSDSKDLEYQQGNDLQSDLRNAGESVLIT